MKDSFILVYQQILRANTVKSSQLEELIVRLNTMPGSSEGVSLGYSIKGQNKDRTHVILQVRWPKEKLNHR